MDPAQQLEEGVTGSCGGALLARRAARNMALDGSLRLIVEGSQSERSQLLGAGMSFGDSHQDSP
jgi:hypothetical protein